MEKGQEIQDFAILWEAKFKKDNPGIDITADEIRNNCYEAVWRKLSYLHAEGKVTSEYLNTYRNKYCCFENKKLDDIFEDSLFKKMTNEIERVIE